MKKLVITILTFFCLSAFSTGAAAPDGGLTGLTGVSPNISQKYGLDAFGARIEDFTAAVISRRPTGASGGSRELFFALGRELEMMESKMDFLAEAVKSDYFSGMLTWDEYKYINRRLVSLGENLERSGGVLERAFAETN